MWRRATRRWRPNPIEQVLAPPTKNADKDGSFYRPALLYDHKAKIPNVPQGPRDKSAKKVIKALEQSRLSKMPPALLKNPNIRVAALIERLPVVQLPQTSWQIDMETVQAFKFEETRQALPKGMFDVWAKESPKWCIEAFKEHFRHRAEQLLPLVTPSTEKSVDEITAEREEEIKQAKRQFELPASSSGDKKKKKKKAAAEGDAAPESEGKKGGNKKPAAAAGGEEAGSKKKESAAADSDEHSTLWHKEMKELGIELEEVEIEQFDDINIQFSLEDDEVVKEEITLEPRRTEADLTNDVTSIRRKLEYKLYLVIKQNGKWTFPSTEWKQGENLLQTAERASHTLFDETERKGDLYFVSMVPQGFRASDDNKSKEFLLRGQLLHGGFDAKKVLTRAKASGVEDLAWLTPKEIGELFAKDGKDEDEVTYINRMLADDWWQEKDSDELSPVLDELSRKPVKELTSEQIKTRNLEEEARREQVYKSYHSVQ